MLASGSLNADPSHLREHSTITVQQHQNLEGIWPHPATYIDGRILNHHKRVFIARSPEDALHPACGNEHD